MDQRLFPDDVPNLIGGAAVPAASVRVDVLNPHNGTVIARIPRSGAAEVALAVAAARAAQPDWAATPGVQRGEILHHVANAMEAHKEEIARIVALEAGKRMPDARGEAAAAIQCARFFAGEGQRLFGRTMTSGMAGRWAMTVRRPCGVAGLIIAANTPAPNFAWKVFPALICGNGVVLKTAEDAKIARSDIARSFLRLANLDSGAFERLGRYEMSLWRQTVQIILLLNSINHGANDGNADCDDKCLYLKNVPRKRRRILWPPFVPFA